MLASKKTKRGVVGAVLLAGILSVSGYALTNVLTVTDVSVAGDGEGTISTVTVADDTIDYTLDATDPSIVTDVDFTLTATSNPTATAEAWLQLVDSASTPTGTSTAGDWVGGSGCVITGLNVACSIDVATGNAATAINVEDIDQFRVVIAD